jgi:hypothetical protein
MLKVNMSISCAITPKLLEDIEMYPISLKQELLDTFTEEESEDEKSDTTMTFSFPQADGCVTTSAPITLDELGELNDKLTEEAKFREERVKRAEAQA